MKSSSKPIGGILLERCPPTNVEERIYVDKFPLDQDPTRWKSCHDAYEYTWNTDVDKQIVGLSMLNKVKLVNSMGYCPHMRCQLSNVSNADANGHCPAGLCFTKIENGALSFGACCFISGEFNFGEMIGYYNKTQTTPKPIYKRSRIVLGGSVGDTDTSYHTFINANLITPNIIASQCPMHNTISDIAQMIKEQNITYWVQLAPNRKVSPRQEDCHYLPDALKSMELVSEVRLTEAASIFANNKESDAEDSAQNFITLEKSEVTLKGGQRFVHVWYRNWKDFDIPPIEDFELLRSIVNEGASVVRDKGKIVISCLSGRGRTGTLSSIIAGTEKGINSHDELVDIIVSMRENRDGMVETPAQYRFASLMLNLPDPSVNSHIHLREVPSLTSSRDSLLSNRISAHAIAENDHTVYITITIILSIFLVLNPVLFMVRKMYI